MDSPCDTIPLLKQFGGKVDLLTDHSIQNSEKITQNEKTPEMCKSSSLLPLVITSQNTIIDIPEYLLNGAYLRDTSVEKTVSISLLIYCHQLLSVLHLLPSAPQNH